MTSTSMSTQMSGKEMSSALTVVSWVLRIIAAVILLQTLFFKFTAAPESVYIFTRVGAEPWGRISSGAIELFASILLLTPRWNWLGSLTALGTMTGAIIAHLTRLGIEVQGDHGLLFALAGIVFLASAANLCLERRRIPLLRGRLG